MLDLDKSLLNTSSSSLGLFLPQTPEPTADFTQYLCFRPNSASDVLGCERRFLLSPRSMPSSVTLPHTAPGQPSCLVSTPAFPNLPENEFQTFNQYSIPNIQASNHSAGENTQLWNLFDDADPWNTVGRILGLETNTTKKPGSSLEDDMRSFMTRDRSGVGSNIPNNNATSPNTTEMPKLGECLVSPCLLGEYRSSDDAHEGTLVDINDGSPPAMELEMLVPQVDNTVFDMADVAQSSFIITPFQSTSDSLKCSEQPNEVPATTSVLSPTTALPDPSDAEEDSVLCPRLFSDSFSDSDEE